MYLNVVLFTRLNNKMTSMFKSHILWWFLTFSKKPQILKKKCILVNLFVILKPIHNVVKPNCEER